MTGSSWPGTALAAGAIISIFSVTLVSLYGQTRILFAMSRDGMIPELFHKVNPRTLTPVKNTIIVAIVVSLLAGLIPINFLAEMTSIGTLAAFITVSIGVIVLRRTAPDLERSFKVPLYPVTPILAILGALWIIYNLRMVTLYVFVIWIAVALVWYFVYARGHSHLGRHEHVGLATEDTPAMTILVGYPPNKQGKSVLGLAAMLARSSGENLVVCTVVPAPWLPGLVREDAAYQGYVDGVAESALAHARAKLLPDVSAEFVRVRARSAPSGLLEAAEQHQATVIVVGSSTAGHFGHITLSSCRRPTAAQLSDSGRPGDPRISDRGRRHRHPPDGRLHRRRRQRPAGAGGAGGGAPARCSHSAGGLRRPGHATRDRAF